MPDYYIGLISGTSMDGVDAVLVEFGEHRATVVAGLKSHYPADLRSELLAASRTPQACTVDVLGRLDHRTGECFRDAANSLLRAAGIESAAVCAIGSHGQTMRHRPNDEHPFTVQIGSPAVIAKGTGIDCVADFRSADIALGGQGAPLVPPFHDWLYRSPDVDRCVVNIGGIANITVLRADGADVCGFDTGPGNTLLDAWSRRHRDLPYDEGGDWAAGGSCDDALLANMLADPYFSLAPPKSTGFEYFNEAWLESHLGEGIDAGDVQATLCELTARSIAAAIEAYAPEAREVIACGGGVHNAELSRRLAANLSAAELETTTAHGLDPDLVEACAFAWLAMRTLDGLPGNAPRVTGARSATILGAIHCAQ